MQIIEEAL